jgi:hypothetical protein
LSIRDSLDSLAEWCACFLRRAERPPCEGRKGGGRPLTPRSAASMRSRSLCYLCGHHQRSWP